MAEDQITASLVPSKLCSGGDFPFLPFFRLHAFPAPFDLWKTLWMTRLPPKTGSRRPVCAQLPAPCLLR